MGKATSAKQKRAGRPPTGVTPMVGVRLSPEVRRSIEDWAARQPDEPSLSEAIRRLVEMGIATAERKRARIPNRALVWLGRSMERGSGQRIKSRFNEQFSAMKEPKGMLMVVHHAGPNEDRLFVRVPEASRQSYPHFRRVSDDEIPTTAEYVAGDRKAMSG